MIHVVSAYITHKDKTLIAKRAHGHMKDHWEFPGGKTEPNETPFDTIRREIKEELNLEIIPQKIIQSFTHTFPNDTITLTLVHCQLSPENQTITSDGSHSEITWIKLEKINHTLTPLTEKAIKHLLTEKPITDKLKSDH